MTRALRPVLLCLLVALPAVVVRAGGLHLPAPVALLVFGAAVVAASFVLAWAAETAEVDISGGLAIAVLAVIAVLPEYAVDLYFAYTAGGNPDYVQFAAANMTGSNRLLLGLGWTSVVLVSLVIASRRAGRPVRAVVLDPRYRMELGFLAIASLMAFLIPLTGQIHVVLGVVLLAFFVFYLVRVSTADDVEEHELVGPAARLAALPSNRRRPVTVAMFVVAAGVILLSAEPFAEALIGSGTALGIDQFLLVQWLAPLASEAPEFIVAILFAVRGKPGAALGMLISAKVNQWTLLIGSLPIAYLLGGGSTSLALDPRQVEEFLLTATQTVLGVAILLALRFPRWAAITLLALFAVQFAIPGTHGRLIVSAVYAAIALVVLVVHRRTILATLAAPFRRSAALRAETGSPDTAASSEAVREPEPVGHR
ncbi:cation:H+ antiporter [Friedmanniella endophytica]|uniref:Cation:H+ antiporter n=1 Tax=Microlunatus kandeliicorticis TaxID=1759536 RepID=A0A7W3IVF9_9ACTN|nr:sodium:proton exchanger [Microlunatus kandeliicorticis]MBA8795982.1 cation:H+ antiporter [Microlunatus kandeliicorticis]